MNSLQILGCTLNCTCTACPEQYDVFFNGINIGYLRLRHGVFYASADVGYDVVYEASPKGDGMFDDDEREFYLTNAVTKLLERYHSQESLGRDFEEAIYADLESLYETDNQVPSVPSDMNNIDPLELLADMTDQYGCDDKNHDYDNCVRCRAGQLLNDMAALKHETLHHDKELNDMLKNLKITTKGE